MPPVSHPRLALGRIQPSIEAARADSRHLRENGVAKASSAKAKKPPAPHSLRARLALLRSEDPPCEPPKPREPTPVPQNPTEAFFKSLKRELDARHISAKDGDAIISPSNSSSPPLVLPKTANVARLESTYEVRARDLETQSMDKIDEAHLMILAKLDALKQSDKKWVSAMREHQKWTIKPLSDIKLDFGPQGGHVRLGIMAKDLNTKLQKFMVEIPKLWNEWETLDSQIKEIAAHLRGGGEDRPNKEIKVADEPEVDIQKLMSEARTELKELGDAAIEKADRAEQDIHSRWKKEKIRIQHSEAQAAESALFG